MKIFSPSCASPTKWFKSSYLAFKLFFLPQLRLSRIYPLLQIYDSLSNRIPILGNIFREFHHILLLLIYGQKEDNVSIHVLTRTSQTFTIIRTTAFAQHKICYSASILQKNWIRTFEEVSMTPEGTISDDALTGSSDYAASIIDVVKSGTNPV